MIEETPKKTILVIEDERPLVGVIQTKLEKTGFDVVTARTVDQGLHYMQEITSKKSKWTKIPIFVVSNTASNTNMQSYLRLGVNVYSVKAEHRLDEIANDIKLFLNKPNEK
jgi:DNA-binding response OmpR family regulator